MAVTGWGFTNYLERAAPVVSAYPFMLSFWGYREFTTGGPYTAVAADLSTAPGGNQRQGVSRLLLDTTYRVGASAYDAVTFSEASTTAVVPLQTWFHGSGAYVSTTLREARLSGGNLVTNTASISPTASDQVKIGINEAFEVWHATSGLAEVSIWDLTGFTEANRTSLDAKLAAGGNPLAITAEAAQPWTGKLVAYWPMTTHTDLADASGNGHTLSTVGTLTTFGSHPTIDPVTPPQIARPSADITVGNWTPSSGTDLYAMINEAVASDANYIQSGETPSSDVCVVGPLVWDETFVDPGVTDFTVRWRYGKNLAAGDTIDLTVELRHSYVSEGSQGTLIATIATLTDVAVLPVAGSYPLSEGEAAVVVANSANLSFRFIANPA